MNNLGNNMEKTVSEISYEIKEIIETAFDESVRVIGEVSNVSLNENRKMIFFTITDSEVDENGSGKKAFLNVACFRKGELFKFLKDNIKRGVVVVVEGKIRTYPPRSSYSLILENFYLVTEEGERINYLKKTEEKFEKLGYFSKPKKTKEDIGIPEKVAVITSLNGAAIKDVVRTIKRRFTAMELLIIHADVQGENSPDSVRKAVEVANIINDQWFKIDVIVITRGGGAKEELDSFNSEEVVEAVYRSKVPVVSAIGHERDFVLLDRAADIRASTPTAAGEIITPSRSDLIKNLLSLENQMVKSVALSIEKAKNTLNDRERQITFYLTTHIKNARRFIQKKDRELDEVVKNKFAKFKIKMSRCETAIKYLIKEKLQIARSKLEKLEATLNALNPENILKRGYSITRVKRGNKMVLLKNAENLKKGDIVETRIYKGSFTSKVVEVLDGKRTLF